MVMNKDDVCVWGSGIDFIDTHIDPKENDTVNVDCGWNYSESLFGNDLNRIKGKLSLDLHSKTFMKMGKLDVPKSKGVSSIKNKLRLDNYVDIYRVILEKQNLDEDGTSSLIIKVGLDNTSDINIPKVKIRSILFDSNGDIIDDRDDDSEIIYGSSKIIDLRHYSIKNSKLKDSYLELFASIYLADFRINHELVAKRNK